MEALRKEYIWIISHYQGGRKMDWERDPWDFIGEKCYWETHGEPGEVLDDDDDYEEEDDDWYE